MLMQAQVPFRNMGGGVPGQPMGGLPAGFNVAPPSANLFSSISLPPMPSMGGGGAGGIGARSGAGDGDDSDNSSGGGGLNSTGGKKTAEQRAAAVQEKNRRAQKRFRERQVGGWVLPGGRARGTGEAWAGFGQPALSWRNLQALQDRAGLSHQHG
jgi:hypothetical protein